MHHRGRHRHEQDLEQRRADHHVHAHAQDIEHRRHQDEPAANPHQHRQYAGKRAQQQRRERRDVQSGTIESPAQGQARHQRMVPPLAGRHRHPGALRAQRADRFVRHQPADPAEHHHIKHVDHRIDLAERLQDAEQHCADPGADDAARHQHPAHLVIDPPAPRVREGARDARTRHLARGRGGGYGGRNAIEDHQRRGQEPAAHAEHSRQQPGQRAERDNDQPVDRKVGDGKVDVHAWPLLGSLT